MCLKISELGPLQELQLLHSRTNLLHNLPRALKIRLIQIHLRAEPHPPPAAVPKEGQERIVLAHDDPRHPQHDRSPQLFLPRLVPAVRRPTRPRQQRPRVQRQRDVGERAVPQRPLLVLHHLRAQPPRSISPPALTHAFRTTRDRRLPSQPPAVRGRGRHAHVGARVDGRHEGEVLDEGALGAGEQQGFDMGAAPAAGSGTKPCEVGRLERMRGWLRAET